MNQNQVPSHKDPGFPRLAVSIGFLLIAVILFLPSYWLEPAAPVSCSLTLRAVMSNVLAFLSVVALSFASLVWVVRSHLTNMLYQPKVWGQVLLFVLLFNLFFPPPCLAQLLGR